MFLTSRHDRQWCSGKCRQAGYRKRKREPPAGGQGPWDDYKRGAKATPVEIPKVPDAANRGRVTR